MNPLDGLMDIVEPPAPGWWPPASGWWIVMAFIVVVVGAVAWIWLHLRRRRHRRVALGLWQQIWRQFEQDADAGRLLAEASLLLRRTALVKFRRQDVAGLTGDAWRTFLAQASGLKELDGELGRWLVELPYQRQVSCNPTLIQGAVRRCLEALT